MGTGASPVQAGRSSAGSLRREAVVDASQKAHKSKLACERRGVPLRQRLEGNCGGDIAKMPYVVNKEEFAK